MPAQWNGDLVLFSHGFRGGPDNPVRDANFTRTAQALQDQGYAVAQASYARIGWALGTAVDDQLGTLEWFRAEVGSPRRTIAVGRSMGGLVSSLIAERPGSGVDGTGNLRIPVLTVHTLADPAAPVEYLSNYRTKARRAGDRELLRDAYVQRTGHCTFTVAEDLAAVGAMAHRLDTGRWGKAAQ